jgi:L-asparagine transporter-like permease
VIGAALLFGGKVVPQYTAQGGFFPLGVLAPLMAMSYALYTFGGVEYVAITTGEARSRKDIAKAVKLTFWTLTLIYLGAIIVLVGVMPWNRAGVTESPFVTVFRTVKIPAASGVMNFVVLTAALSGANAALYAASRMLFSLARTGWAPAKLGTLNRSGSPRLALLCSSYGILVALILEKWAPANAFVWILGAALFGLMLSWLVSLAAHVRFRQRITPSELAELPMRARLGAPGSVLGFSLVTAAILHTWWSSRVSMISGIAYLIGLTIAYYAIRTGKRSQIRSAKALPQSPDSTITT